MFKGILAGEAVVVAALFVVIGGLQPQPDAMNWAFGLSLFLAVPAAILLGVVLIAARLLTRRTNAGLAAFAALSAGLAAIALPALSILSSARNAISPFGAPFHFPPVFVGGAIVLAIAGGVGGMVAGRSYGYR